MFAQNTKIIETNYNNNLFPELFWLDKMFCNIQNTSETAASDPFVDILQKMFLKICNIHREAIA